MGSLFSKPKTPSFEKSPEQKKQERSLADEKASQKSEIARGAAAAEETRKGRRSLLKGAMTGIKNTLG
jgi:hypothetical protein